MEEKERERKASCQWIVLWEAVENNACRYDIHTHTNTITLILTLHMENGRKVPIQTAFPPLSARLRSLTGPPVLGSDLQYGRRRQRPSLSLAYQSAGSEKGTLLRRKRGLDCLSGTHWRC